MPMKQAGRQNYGVFCSPFNLLDQPSAIPDSQDPASNSESMSEKKHKREGTSNRPSKKVAIARSTSADTVKVSILEDADSWTPILGTYQPRNTCNPQLAILKQTPCSIHTRPLPPLRNILQTLHQAPSANVPLRPTHRDSTPQPRQLQARLRSSRGRHC